MIERTPPTQVTMLLAWAFFCGLLAAALGVSLYWTVWLLREILG